MGVFCDRLKFGSTAALDCCTGQNKDRYCQRRALIATRLVGKSIDGTFSLNNNETVPYLK